MSDSIRAGLDSLAQHVAESVAKPRLRGWLHLGTAPVTLAAGVVLIALSPTAATRLGSVVYVVSSVLLFSVSAIYHRGRWSPRVTGVLRRLDHSNIFLLIAGTYTPFSLLLLQGTDRVVLLSVIWLGALLGVGFRVLWIDAPRWLCVPIYVALGCAAVFVLPEFAAGSERYGVGIGTAVLVLIAAGGVLYILGGAVYGFRRPDPWPRYFGFHEVFHSFTVLAFVAHYVGISLATYSLR
ncbi:PAQR family membrane homeostasis protein TrhA [Nocardioides sp.]|jgi:hemolysin III|uniref:PAQR family membrane homeostasis protein TrhA n=1 Tax=Nocardioides sp. TaxID=35761 RepID=UPI002F400EE5